MKTAKMKTKPEKYTAEFVLSELEDMIEQCKNDEDLVFLGELFIDREYSRQRFSDWPKKFHDNERIMDAIQKVKEIFETRAIAGGLKGKLNSSMTKFHLINNYDWKDKSEQELSGPNGQPLGIAIIPAKDADPAGR